MNLIVRSTLAGLCLLGTVTVARAQLSGTLSVPSTSYPTITSVVAALNTQGVGTGGVTINVTAGYTETITATLSLTATGTSANPIVFQKSGSGANPVITAYSNATGTATAASAAPDGIWNFVGSDYVTIDGIDLAENTANNTAAAAASTQAAAAGILMEYGYGFFKASATDGAQNNTVKNCTITLNRLNWTAASAGPLYNGSVGIDLMACTPTATQTTITVTAASGASSNNKFYSNTIQNCNAAIAMVGYGAASPYTLADQNNDIGGIAASTGNTIINFGGGTGATVESAGIYIKDQWGYNASYNTVNSNNGSGVNHPRALRGIYTNGSAGASGNVNNNTVTIAGGGTTQSCYAIDVEAGSTANTNTINVNNNTVQNCTYTTATSGSMYAIFLGSSATTVNANNNTVSNHATSASTSGGLIGIYNNAAPTNLSINNNTVSGFAFGSTTSSGATYFIYNSGTMTGTFTINNNLVQNSTNLNASGSIYMIYNNNSSNSYNVQNNTFSNISRAASQSGTMYGHYNNGGGSGTVNLSGNRFNNISQLGSGTFYGLHSTTGSAQSVNYANNKFTNIAVGSGTTYIIYNTYGNVVNINNDTINNITTAGTLYGIYAGSSSTTNCNSFSNVINTLYSTGANSVYGIYMNASNTASVNTAYKNKIYDLQDNQAGGSVYGIYVSAGTTHTVYNNLIGDLKTPAATGNNAIAGIYVSSVTTANIYDNTVYLNASSSGTTFGSSALYVSSTTPIVTSRNNILVNNSTPGGTGGFTAAFRYASAPGSSYAAASNNNLFYAGTAATNSLIYGEGTGATATNGQQTLAAYKTYVTGKDVSSVTENPSFASTSGAAATFLHFAANTTSVAESGGANIAGITDDYDGDIRQGNAGYTGTGTAPDIGADEFTGVAPTPTINSVSITPTGNQCTAVSRTVTASVSPSTSGAPLTSVTLNYSLNGTAQTPITMTGGSLTATSTWTATIPVSVPVNATVIWSVVVTDATFTKTASGPTYHDAPLLGLSVAASANPATVCAGSSTTLSASPAPANISNYDVTATTYNLLPTPGTGVTTLASGGTATTALTSGSLDDGYWTVTLPFSFSFYGTSSTTASIGTNGDVQFGTPVNGGYGNAWPTTTSPTGAFAALFGDLNTNAGTVNYFVTGTSPNRVFVINWTNVNWYSATPSASFQAKLYEGSNVLETHITSTTSGNNHLTSVQNFAGTSAVTPASRTLGSWTVTTPEAWRFTPQIVPGGTYLWTGTGIAAGTQTLRNATATPTGPTTTYTVTVTDSNACSMSGTVAVAVTPLPATPTATNSVQCGVGIPTASVSGGTGTYKWYSAATGGTLLQRGGSTYATSISATTTFYVADSSGLCESQRVAVIASVNTPDAIAAKANGSATPASVCLGTAVSLTATKTGTTNNYTYTWTANPVTGSNITATGTTGQNISVTPTAAGTYAYTVTGIDGTCTAVSTVNVTIVNPFANTTTLTSATRTSICAGSLDTLTAQFTAPFFTEQFETSSFPLTSFVTASVSGTPTATQNTTYFTQGTSSLLFNTASTGADVSLSSANSLNLTSYSAAKLTFSHIAAMEGYLSSYDYGYVQYSTDGGTTWTSFPTSSYVGSATLFNSVVSFSTLSYANWTNTLTGASATPTNSLWQNETINIPATALSSTQFKIRFRYTTDGSINYYGWLLDDIKIIGTSTPATSWSNGTTVVGTTNPLSIVPPSTTTYTPTITYSGCTSVAPSVTVNVNPIPTATVTPSGTASFCAGSNQLLMANTGTGYTYQWKLNGTNITGATAGTYTATGAGSYTVVVTSASNCSMTSAATVLTVTPLPTATITPAGPTTFCTGGNVVLNANTGTGLTYQWRQNGTDITGATTSSYTATTAGIYTVKVTGNSCFAISQSVTVIVNTPPTATITPNSATTFCQGDSVLLVANTGTGLTYQWKLNGNNISGASNAVYLAQAAGSYTVAVSNGGCSTTSNPVVVTVNPLPVATVSANGPTSFCSGGSVVLTGNTGTGLTYQWRLNGANIAGATTNSYTASQTGIYRLVINNGTCSGISAPVNVVVFPLPSATITPLTATTICANDTAVLQAPTAQGNTYQWHLNGNNIAGATASTYQTNVAGSYTVTVTTANGCTATSATAVVITVFVSPNTTVTHNKPLAICDGDNVLLSVAMGTGYTYQWYQNGSMISGATDATYTASQAGSYTVRVVTPNGCAGISAAETVSVLPLVYPIISISGNVLSTSGFTNYQWFLNNSPIAGATDSSYTVMQNGFYTVQGTAPNGCSVKSAIASIQFLGIETIRPEMIKIYPNPAASIVYIDAPANVNVALCSVDGRVLQNLKNARQLDVSGIADGVYMIRVMDENNVLVKIEKLLKASR